MPHQVACYGFLLSGWSYRLGVADSLGLNWHPCVRCLATLHITVQVALYLRCCALYQYVIDCHYYAKPLGVVFCLVQSAYMVLHIP